MVEATASGTPAPRADVAISASVRPAVFSAGWVANSAVLKAMNVSGAWSATSAAAAAARVEQVVPSEASSRKATGWYSTTIVPSPRSWSRVGPLTCSKSPQYGHMSVSYTHLRAHETRHDLVCRLLLEKKKTHKQE